METIRTQLAVIGAGPGGYTAALRAAQRGASVCLIERAEVGGVCLNRGCIPTKTMVASAELYAMIGRAEEFGLAVTEARPEMERIVARKDEVVRRLIEGVRFLIKKGGVELVHGNACFTGPGKLSAATAEGEVAIAAEQIIVAAGTEALVPPIFNYDGRVVITSDEALNLTKVPSRLIVIGGGVVGCEFASIYRRLGAEVAVVELLPGLLPMFDADLGRYLRTAFKKRGISVHTGQKVEEVKHGGDEAEVRLASGELLAGDKVLVAVGRRTVAHDLALHLAGLGTNEHGKIPVNERLETSVAGIYAIGDINDRGFDLAHAAAHQGLAVAETLYGPGRHYSEEAVPNAVFTDPEAATVGLSADEAGRRGLAVRTGKIPYQANGKALAMGESEGWVKVLTEEGSGRILGVHILGAHAADLLGEAALAVRNRLTAADLAQTVHAHPTLPEMLMEAAEASLMD